MLSVIAALLTLAAPDVGESSTLKVAAPGVQYVGIDEKTGEFYLDYFARQLAGQKGISVITRSQVNAVLGLERQKALLGCNEAECSAELAGALGVDAIITGNIGKVGSSWIVNLSLISAKDGSTISSVSERVANEDALLDSLSSQAKVVAHAARPDVNPAPEAAVVTKPEQTIEAAPVDSGSRSRAWIAPTAFGAVLLGGTAATYMMASSRAESLRTGEGVDFRSIEDVAAYRRQGQQLNAMSLALGASALLSFGTAGALLSMPAESSARKFVPLAASGVALASGAVLLGMSSSDASRIRGGEGITSRAQLDDARAAGEAKQAAGVVMLATGALGAIGSGVLFAFGGGSTAAVVSAAPVNGGGFVQLTFRN